MARRILIVDDDPVGSDVLGAALENAGYAVLKAQSGEAALTALACMDAKELPEIIFLDIQLGSGMDGLDVCRRLKAQTATKDIAIIFLTGREDAVCEVTGFAIGAADFIHKPISRPIVLARVRTQMMLRDAAHRLDEKNDYLEREVARRTHEIQQKNEELRISQEVTMVALASLAETRDNETGNHLFRTQHYIRALANHLRETPVFADVLDDSTVERLFMAAPLHDVGKVGIPDCILRKPGPLAPDEFEIMKTHTTIGRDVIDKAQRRVGARVALLETAMEIALSHQEWWDGSGYPQGLAGPAIPLSARLMALADVYDALISERVYRDALPHAQASRIIAAGRGTQFDPGIVDAFMALDTEFQRVALRFSDAHIPEGLTQ